MQNITFCKSVKIFGKVRGELKTFEPPNFNYLIRFNHLTSNSKNVTFFMEFADIDSALKTV